MVKTKRQLTCQLCSCIRTVTTDPSSGNIWLCSCGHINSLRISDLYVDYMVPRKKERRHPLVTVAMVLAALSVGYILAQDLRNSWQREQVFRARVAAQDLVGHTPD